MNPAHTRQRDTAVTTPVTATPGPPTANTAPSASTTPVTATPGPPTARGVGNTPPSASGPARVSVT
ncbi:hypothetical protein [Streptomyces sp. NRRL WC-3744]|uniref:hypothetical protein n=1 Tax=Streptomyces sp. NRRL WC-3744 TaxID=1463935 RepID=UPI00131ECF48|nr:hypothetical protein [Streptomyces sp. NRRL WC-3744]